MKNNVFALVISIFIVITPQLALSDEGKPAEGTEEGATGSGAGTTGSSGTAAGSAAAGSAALANGQIGTQGMFAAIQARGNVQVGFSAATGISDFDDILRNLDTQGAIEENMLFLDRQTALDFDDMLAAISSGSSGGTKIPVS